MNNVETLLGSTPNLTSVRNYKLYFVLDNLGNPNTYNGSNIIFIIYKNYLFFFI